MIHLDHVVKTYIVGDEPVRALRGVSLRIDAGEYISVMGPSGSGKSTLLNMIGLLDRPDSGEYWLAPESGAERIATRELSEEQRARLRSESIGFIFQAFHLVNRLSAFENIELPLMLAGAALRPRRKMVRDVLQQVGLLERQDHLPNQLSGGQLQRVAIARAIVMKPRILLADEPTGNLDLASGRDVMEVLEGLNEEGITLMMVTHDEALGRRAHRRIRMVDGNIDTDVTTEDDVHSEG